MITDTKGLTCVAFIRSKLTFETQKVFVEQFFESILTYQKKLLDENNQI